MDKPPKKQALDKETVIADMNIEGMPWHRTKKPSPSRPHLSPLTRTHTLRLTLSVVGTALLIAAVFIGGGALFIWFCTDIWLR